MKRVFKRIISIILVMTFMFSYCFNLYAKTVEENVSVGVGETVQLKIDVGATKIEWETSSRRIAEVSRDGVVTPVKVGTCDILCHATYTSFIFFKENVEYIFHLTVSEASYRDEDNRNDREIRGDEDLPTRDELLSYRENNSSYYLTNASVNFTFDIEVSGNIENSYTIYDLYKNTVETNYEKTSGNVYKISPKKPYEKLTSYIVNIKNDVSFVDEDFAPYKTLIFLTEGENTYDVVFNDNVITEVINLSSDKVVDTSASAGVNRYHIDGLKDYNEGQIIITKDTENNDKMPYKVVGKDATGIVVEVADIDDVFNELNIYYKGPMKLDAERLNNDNELLAAISDNIREKVLDKLIMTTYAKGNDDDVKIRPHFECGDDGKIKLDVTVEAGDVKFVVSTEFTLEVLYYVDDFFIRYLSTLELYFWDFETNIYIEGGLFDLGSEIDDEMHEFRLDELFNGEAAEHIEEIFSEETEKKHFSKRLVHSSIDVMDIFGGAVTFQIRNEIMKEVEDSIGILGIAFDIDIVDYLSASLDISVRLQDKISFMIGASLSRGLYGRILEKNQLNINANLVGKIRNTLLLPRVRVQAYLFSSKWVNFTVQGGPEIDALAAGRLRLNIVDMDGYEPPVSFLGYIKLDVNIIVSASFRILLDFPLYDNSWNIWSKTIGDELGIEAPNDTTKIKSIDQYAKLNTIYKRVIDLDSKWLDTKKVRLSFTDSDLKYYLDSGKNHELIYKSRGLELVNTPDEDFDIYIVYKNKFTIPYHIEIEEVAETTTTVRETTTIRETTTKAPTTTIPITTMPPTTVPPETVPPETTITGRGRIEGKVMARVGNDTIDIPGARVDFYNDDGSDRKLSYAITGNDGKFRANLPTGNYRLMTSAAGFTTLTSHESVIDDETTYVEIYILFDENETGLGSASGKIINAVNGAEIEGVNIKIRSGWNNKVGSYAVSETFYTDSHGNYTIEGVNVGYYTIEMSKSGYTKEYKNILILHNNPVTDYNFTLNPILTAEGDVRIVLSWGARPSDLDSHLIGKVPNNTYFDVHYRNKKFVYQNTPMANLDRDDTTSYGPETITITSAINGNYIYGVHDFSNQNSSTSTALSNSDCNVSVYVGETLLRKFNIPTGESGTFWEVFSIDENYNITPINEIYHYNPLSKNFSRFSINGNDDYNISTSTRNVNETNRGGDIVDEETTTQIRRNVYTIANTESVSYNYEDVDSRVKIQIRKPLLRGGDSERLSTINENIGFAIDELKGYVEEYIDLHESEIKTITFDKPTFIENNEEEFELEFVGKATYKDGSDANIKYKLEYDIEDDDWELTLKE